MVTPSLILGSVTSAVWSVILLISKTISERFVWFMFFSISEKDSSVDVGGIRMYRLFLSVRGSLPTWNDRKALGMHACMCACINAFVGHVGNGAVV